MKIYYRISDAGYNKVKPSYINNEACLQNFCNVFFEYIHDIVVIADNCSTETMAMIKRFIDPTAIHQVSIGSGAGTFNYALDQALKLEDEEIVYFVENDYLHMQGSPTILKEGFHTGASYVSLYDHPDKYMNGANPYVEDGGEATRVVLTKSIHWKITNSTTMTFAAAVGTLRADEPTLREFTVGTYPRDFDMFLSLGRNGKALVTPIPGYSTHGETAWLTPLTDWSTI